MLALDSVTLCGVDTRTPLLALQALQRSMREIQFGAAILFANDRENLRERTAALGVTLVDIGSIDSIESYSKFMLSGFGSLIPTEFALITQWDGFVINPNAWCDKFLAYDYVGALWPDWSDERAVGNGGFSLRSKRLLKALTDPAIVVSHPEDLCICHVNRERLEREHGIRFAPPSLAARFSYENVPSATPTFGFHGISNLMNVLTPVEVLNFTRALTIDMTLGAGVRELARFLVYDGQYEAAHELLRKRIGGGDRRWRTISLWARLWLRRRFGVSRRIT